MSFDDVVNALAALDPQPRRTRWRSLSCCVLDAVWSIGSRYVEVVDPVVRAVALANGDDEPLVDAAGPLPRDPAPRYIAWVTLSDGRGSLPAIR